MSEKAWQSKVDKLNKEYFTRLEKRNEKNQGQFKDINFKPEINSKSMKILEKVRRRDNFRKEIEYLK